MEGLGERGGECLPSLKDNFSVVAGCRGERIQGEEHPGVDGTEFANEEPDKLIRAGSGMAAPAGLEGILYGGTLFSFRNVWKLLRRAGSICATESKM